MNLNPEFQRQLVLELTPARLAGVPLVLGVLIMFSYFLDGYTFSVITANNSFGLFVIVVGFWGARQAVNAVLDEQRERTWDTQRLSALGPWQMLWGKLLGSTLVTWYGGAICLVVYGIASSKPGLMWFYTFVLLGGLLVQGVSMLMGMVSVLKGRFGSHSMPIFVFLLALWLWLSLLDNGHFDMTHFNSPETVVTWYGIGLTLNGFLFINLSVALFWVVTGTYRLLANELCIRTLPWVWLAFLLFLIVYLGGYLPSEHSQAYVFYALAYFICLFFGYMSLLLERNEPMRIKRLLTYLSQENLKRLLEELPLWCVSVVLAVPFAVLLTFIDVPVETSVNEMHFYALPILLLMLRDTGIYLFYSYGKNPERALVLLLLTAGLLYGVLPFTFAEAGQWWLLTLIVPLFSDNELIAILLGAVQVTAVFWLVYQRWYQRVYKPATV